MALWADATSSVEFDFGSYQREFKARLTFPVESKQNYIENPYLYSALFPFIYLICSEHIILKK
jgi:hypothetical protein